MEDPAFRAVGIADLAPVVEFPVISTGRPARTEVKATSYSWPGPRRTFTLFDFRLTKRGSGSPVPRGLVVLRRSRPAAIARMKG